MCFTGVNLKWPIGVSFDGFYNIGLGLFFFGAFLLFSTIWLDAVLGLNVAKPILLLIYGVDAIRVVVQNIYGGNNLQFFVRNDEESKIPEFEKYKFEKIYSVENKNASSSGIDDIEKLSNLKDKGIISEEEFELKKKMILGL